MPIIQFIYRSKMSILCGPSLVWAPYSKILAPPLSGIYLSIYISYIYMGSSAPGPPGYDRYGQFDSSFEYQPIRKDPFPILVAVDSRASPLG